MQNRAVTPFLHSAFSTRPRSPSLSPGKTGLEPSHQLRKLLDAFANLQGKNH